MSSTDGVSSLEIQRVDGKLQGLKALSLAHANRGDWAANQAQSDEVDSTEFVLQVKEHPVLTMYAKALGKPFTNIMSISTAYLQRIAAQILHRQFFARAMLDSKDPMQCSLTPSVLATFRSAITHLNAISIVARDLHQGSLRHHDIWFYALSSIVSRTLY